MKVVALTPFPIIPNHFGGAERCFNLLSRIGSVEVHALSWEGGAETISVKDLAHCVSPVSPAAIDQSRKIQGQGFLTFDAMPHITRAHLSEFYEKVHASNPDLIVLEHPWLVDFVGNVPFIYDAHNAEAHGFGKRFALRTPEYLHIKDLERRAVTEAAHVTYCSAADADILAEMYGKFEGTHIPNGTDLPNIEGRKPGNSLFFIGSVYQPNVDAAQRLINLAPLLPEFEIVIAGPCSYWVDSKGFSNVTLVGPVSDEKRHELFLNAYAFVNLIFAGSGTHLKVARALSYGLPVVTTKLGSRGYHDLIVAEIPEVPDAVREISKDYSSISTLSRKQAEQLSWDAIGSKFSKVINATLF
jgi:glycosyltransferase involved in cell wall biosynthesis